MKKILSLLTAFCMLLSMIPNVSATDTIASFDSIVLGEEKTVETVTDGEYVYLQFVPEITEAYTFYAAHSNTEDTCGIICDSELNPLNSDDDSGGNSQFAVHYVLEAGKTYLLGARMFSANISGDITVGVMISHDCIPGEMIQAPTCQEDGIQLMQCKYCEHSYENTIPAGEDYHNYVDGICSICGENEFIKTGTCGDEVYWTLDLQTGLLEITGSGDMEDYLENAPWFNYRGSITTVSIADGVTSIGDYSFFDCYKLTALTIPDSVTTIGNYAFQACEHLVEVMIPDSVTSIGEGTFISCALTRITIPDSVTNIGAFAFATCIYATEVTIPDSVTFIGDYAFEYCGNLKVISFRGDAPRIEYNVFSWVEAYCYYPGSNPTWTDDIRTDYGGTLTWIAVSDECMAGNHSFTNYVSDDNGTCQTNGTKSALCDRGCGAVDTVEEPNSKKDHLFDSYVYDSETNTSTASCEYGCGSTDTIVGYPSITLGEEKTVKTVADGGYMYLAFVPEITEAYTFYAAHSNTEDTYGIICDSELNPLNSDDDSGGNLQFAVHHVLEAGKTYFLGARMLNSNISGDITVGVRTSHYCIPDEIIQAPTCQEDGIQLMQCQYCDHSYEDTIPAGEDYHNYVDGICSLCGENEFIKTGTCGDGVYWTLDLQSGLLEITGSGDVEGSPWFNYRESITTVSIAQGVTSIGNYAFDNCFNLTEVTIPDSVTTIGYAAFEYCSGLTEVTIPDSVTSIGYAAFMDCSNLAGIWVAEGNAHYSSDSYGVLFNKSKDTLIQAPGAIEGSYTIPDSVTRIRNSAFSRCSSLTEITIPDSVTRIGNSAFSRCFNLTEVTIPDSVTTIGSSAFEYCTNLQFVTLPEQLEELSNSLFFNCTSLLKLSVPASVNTIDFNALGNNNLVGIDFGQPVTVAESVYYDGLVSCDDLQTVSMPNTVESVSFLSNFSTPEYIRFEGDPFSEGTIQAGITCYYPGSNEKWTEEVRDSMGTDITWIAISDDCLAGNHTFTEYVTVKNAESINGDLYYSLCDRCAYVEVSKDIFPSDNTNIVEYLTGILEQEDISGEGVKNAVQQLDPDSLKTALESGDVDQLIEELEIKVNETGSEVQISNYVSELQNENIKILGAALNDVVDPEKNIVLAINAATEEVEIPEEYANGNILAFSMTLENVHNSEELDVPVKIILPVPDDFDVNSLVILHYNEDGTLKETIDPNVFEEAGQMYVSFVVSGFSNFAMVDVHAHTPVTDEAVAPTCTQTGLTEGEHCSVCGEVLTAQEVLPATGHDYSEFVTEATCTEKGYTTFTCACGDSYIDEYVDVLAHRYGEWETEVEATCMERGEERRYCVNCDTAYETRQTEATGHSFSGYVSDDNATCTTDGTKTAICDNCDETDTITDSGSATGHAWDDGKVTKEPAIGVEGIKTFTCDNCGETRTETIPALPDEPADEPCKHTSTKLVDQKDATCTATGYTGDKVCTVCGDTVEKGTSIALKPHTEVTDKAVAATCTTTGKTEGKHCAVCQTVMVKQETVPATGHSWGEWEVTKPATGADMGEEKRSCTVCGLEETRSIDKLTHPFTDVAPGKFYETPVLWAVENEITTGMTPTTFEPDTKCNRAQVVTFLWRAAGSPEPTSAENPFVDVIEGKFYYKAVLWAVEAGITNGVDDTHFGTNDECTRGHVATFLWRTMNKPSASSSDNPFTDVQQGKFYYDAVLWAVESGITNGMGNNLFQPNGTCTRGQVVTFLYRSQN